MLTVDEALAALTALVDTPEAEIEEEEILLETAEDTVEGEAATEETTEEAAVEGASDEAAADAEAETVEAAPAAAQPLMSPAGRLRLGLATPQVDALAREWRQTLDLETRVTLAGDLWDVGLQESMIAAAKLFEQARIRPDDSAVWAQIVAWVGQLDDQQIADHVATSGQKRLVADPDRVAELEAWMASDNPWTRRAILGMTTPWAKMNFPSERDLAVREAVLAMAFELADDPSRMVRQAVKDWLRVLSRHDAARAEAFRAARAARPKAAPAVQA